MHLQLKLKTQALALALGAANLASSAAVPRSPEIVNGTSAYITSYPYQVALNRHSEPWCGGSILSARHILTAAHCLDHAGSLSDLTVRAGSSFVNEGGQLLEVASIAIHPRFNHTTLTNDIGVVEVRGSIALGTSAWPVELAQGSEGLPAEGTPATVTGFGATSEAGQGSRQLMYLDVPVLNKQRCAEAFQALNPLTASMFCAGYFEGERDACQGDSGGALVEKGTAKLIGVVSWGYGCARAGYPGVYTSIAIERDFISQTTGL